MRDGLLLVAVLLVGTSAVAQTRPAANAADADDNYTERLGDVFSSRAGGISFRPPGGGTMARRMGVGSDIVQYGSIEENWTLRVSRIVLDKPMRLMAEENPAGAAARKPEAPGVLDQTAMQIRLQNAGTQILRKDVVNIGTNSVGVLICRYAQGRQTWLRQQAFVEANDQLYFVFDFTTLSSRAAGEKEKDDEDDPAERVAAGVFRAMLDTIQLIDQRPILEDNRKRLERTHVMQPNLPGRIRKAIVPEQYYRVLLNGKDIGWSYVTEELGQHESKDGFIIAAIYHAAPDKETVVDISSEMFCMLDMKKADELWVSVNTIQREGAKQVVTEIGQSSRRMKRVVEEPAPGAVGAAGQNPTPRMVERYTMTVAQTGPAGSKTINRDLPLFWYLPQGVGSLLPRLLPLNEPKGYLYSTWVGAEQELIFRYIDVEPERQVNFCNEAIDAIVVKDRIGLEGEPTLHYMTAEGKYLGSYKPSNKLTVLATDAQTLARLWPNATIARPRLLDSPIPGKK